MVVTQQPRIKEYWSPCGRRESVQDYYVVRRGSMDYTGYWGLKVDPDGSLRDRTSDAERERFLDDTHYITSHVNALRPRAVLDVGAGPGWMLSAIGAKQKLAVEIEEKAVAHLVAAGVTVLSELYMVPPACCDVVIAHHVIEHLVDPIDAMNNIHRILKKGGTLILGTPDFGCPCAKRFGPRYRMLHDSTHISLFTLESCSRMLRDLDFTIDVVEFPFPERYATVETFMRWNDMHGISPPWPGNWMTFFCRKGG